MNKMVSVSVETNEMGVRFTFDATDLNEGDVKQVVMKTFGAVQRSFMKRSDVRNMVALNPKGITVYMDPETRHVECNVPYMEIRVQMKHVPGVTPHARVVHEETTADSEMSERVCSAMNKSLMSTSPDSETS